MGYPYPNPNPNGEKKNALVRTGLAIDPRPLPTELYIEPIDDLLLLRPPPPNPEPPLRMPYPDEKDDPRIPPMRPPLLAADAGLAKAKFSNSAPKTMLDIRLKGNCLKTALKRAPNEGAGDRDGVEDNGADDDRGDDHDDDQDDGGDDRGDDHDDDRGDDREDDHDDDRDEEAAPTPRVDVGPCLPRRIPAGHRCTKRLARGIVHVGPRATINVALHMLRAS